MPLPEYDGTLEELIEKLGMAFHPETKIADYINLETGEPTFTDAEAVRLQTELDFMWLLHGNEIFNLMFQLEPWKTYLEKLAQADG